MEQMRDLFAAGVIALTAFSCLLSALESRQLGKFWEAGFYAIGMIGLLLLACHVAF